MEIALSDKEKDLLGAILEDELEDVRAEARRTEAHDYKERLKERLEMIRALLDKLAA